jgi:hypothetical protein
MRHGCGRLLTRCSSYLSNGYLKDYSTINFFYIPSSLDAVMVPEDAGASWRELIMSL